jgi:hypothetical protein
MRRAALVAMTAYGRARRFEAMPIAERLEQIGMSDSLTRRRPKETPP